MPTPGHQSPGDDVPRTVHHRVDETATRGEQEAPRRTALLSENRRRWEVDFLPELGSAEVEDFRPHDFAHLISRGEVIGDVPRPIQGITATSGRVDGFTFHEGQAREPSARSPFADGGDETRDPGVVHLKEIQLFVVGSLHIVVPQCPVGVVEHKVGIVVEHVLRVVQMRPVDDLDLGFGRLALGHRRSALVELGNPIQQRLVQQVGARHRMTRHEVNRQGALRPGHHPRLEARHDGEWDLDLHRSRGEDLLDLIAPCCLAEQDVQVVPSHHRSEVRRRIREHL